MSERKYRDEDVRRILELATRSEAAAPLRRGPEDGLTLPEIQSIALEVGVPADAVARAAASLDASTGPRPRTSLGMPIEVSHTTPLPRDLTDAEWAQLVAELRSTFRARGHVEVQGGVREWFNGNLHAAVEPTADGYRLRLGTFKGSAPGLNALGMTGVAAGVVVFTASAMAGAPLDPMGPLVLSLAGAGAFLANLVRLPRWAKQRDRQMKSIGAKALRIMGSAVALLLMITCPSALEAQKPGLTAHTLAYDSAQARPAAVVSDFGWLAGHWRGPGLGGVSEEVWSAPEANSMMGMYRLMKDGAVVFYELLSVQPDGRSVVLALKHFNADLTGWEEQHEVRRFRLLKLTPHEAYFEGITFRRLGPDSIVVLVALERDDGTATEAEFRYSRVKTIDHR